MDALRSLKAALAHARWLSRSDEALVLVPNLLAELPELVEVSVQGSAEPVAPCGFSPRLRDPVCGLIAARLKAARAGSAREDLQSLQPQVLKEDPLVRELAELLVEAAPFGRPAQSVVLLELVRLSSSAFAGDPVLLETVQIDGLSTDLAWLSSQEPQARGSLLGGLAFSIQVRLGAAYALTKGLARPGRLYQSLVASRLPLVLRAQDLELPRDLVTVARVLELPTADRTLRAAWTAGKGALEEGMAQDSAAGAILRAQAAEGRAIQGLMMSRESLGLALSLLPSLLDERQLRGLGLDRQETAALLGPSAVAATTGLLEVVQACRRLDLISALSACVLPVERRGGKWKSGGSPVRAPLLELLVPSSLDEAPHGVVVAFSLGEQAGKLCSEPRGLGGLAALERIWSGLQGRCEELGGRIRRGGPPFLAVFGDEPGARAFEDLLRDRLEGVDLQIGSLGTVTMTEEFVLQHREGPLVGGWCGATVVLAGPPVEAALGMGGGPGVWAEEPETSESASSGPAFDPFAATPVDVELDEDSGPPSDWAAGGIAASVSEEPDPVSVPPEDLGEAVSYDLLGVLEEASVDEVLLEALSQDTIPEDDSLLGESLDAALSEDSLDVALSEHSLDPDQGMVSIPEDTESVEVEAPERRTRPAFPGLGETSGHSMGSEDSIPVIELGGISEPPSTPEPPDEPESLFAELGGDDDSDDELEFKIEDEEDSEFLDSEIHADSAVSPAEALQTFDMLGESMDGPAEPSEPDPVDLGGEAFYLPPPDESEESLAARSAFEVLDSLPPDDDGLIDFSSLSDDDPSLAGEGFDALEEGDISIGGDGPSFPDLDISMDSVDDSFDFPTDEPSPVLSPEVQEEPPAFPDLGFDIDASIEESEPSMEPPEPPSEEPRISRADLDFLFQGYVMVPASKGFVFGRAYGSTLVDVHRYEHSDPDEAHRAFARDKIRERFSPASDETLTLSGRDRPEALSLDLLMSAFEES